MKTENRKTGKLSFGILTFLVFAVICFTTYPAKAQRTLYTINGNAECAQMVPAVSGSGTGTITGTYSPSTKVLEYASSWNNLTGAPRTAGFYKGAPGVSGAAFGDPWALGTNSKPDGNITGKLTLTGAQEKDLLAGNFYYTYTTDSNPKGEIRGQITARQQ